MLNKYVVALIGSRVCAFRIGEVSLAMRTPVTTALPATPPFVLGVAVVRGSLTVILDGHRLLGENDEPGQRMLVLTSGGRNFGLTVDSISGVAEIEESDPEKELVPLMPHITSEWIERLVKVDASFAAVLAAGRIVPEAVWESLRSAGQHG